MQQHETALKCMVILFSTVIAHLIIINLIIYIQLRLCCSHNQLQSQLLML